MGYRVVFENQNVQWIDVVAPTQNDFLYLQENFGINEMHLEDAIDPSHLPKYERDDDIRFFLIRENVALERKNLNGIQDISTKLSVFLVDKTLITIHRIQSPTLQFVTKEIEKDNQLKQELYRDRLFLMIALSVIESFDNENQRLINVLDKIENEIFLNSQLKYNPIKKLYRIKRKAGLNARILSLSSGWINATKFLDIDEIELADLLDKQRDAVSDYEHLNNQITNLISMYIALSDQKANQVMKLLAIYSVYFLPITFIAGLYGMNFDFMPELRYRYAYFITLGVMLLIVIATFLFFKKKKF